jgi:hypothetical protein
VTALQTDSSHRLLNQAVPTEGLIRIKLRSEILINKKIVNQYVRIGAGAGSKTCHVLLLFVDVSMAANIGKPLAVFVRPACPTCGSRMSLVRIFPDRSGHDQHTYECPRCADEITEIVRAPSAPLTEVIE